MPPSAQHPSLEMVFFDIGGVIYRDTVYARALNEAMREMGASFTDDEFDAEYRAAKDAQAGSFRRRLAARFLGPDADMAELERIASGYWAYPPDALEPDVKPCLDVLAGRYRLGIIANQPSAVRGAMRRDGIDAYFEVWGVSDDVGLEKPDPRLFAHVLYVAGIAPPRSAMIGDRLDYDVRPARRAGMHAIWMLRGEAPSEPTAEQLSEADAAIHTLDELPKALEAL